MSEHYSGVSLLESLECATNYNGHIGDLIKKNFNGRTLVDFGAGTGTFARWLRRHNIDVECVEQDRQLREALEYEGFTTYAQLTQLVKRVDGIYSINVLEHIKDDAAAVAAIYERLKPGGVVIIYVPAFPSLYSAVDKKIGHHRRYTRETLAPLFKDFEIVKLEYVDSVGFLVAYVFKKLFPKKETVSTLSIKLFDTLLFPISKFLDKKTRHSFGKNVLLVAKKQ